MRERPNDLRVTKTIKAIHAAFEEMMCEMPYRDITVKALCERALVNKKTFYRYYETMDFLLAEFQETMMTDYLERVENLHIPEDLDRITREFFLFATERGTVFERITCTGPHETLRQQMTTNVLERHGATEQADPHRALLMAFVTEATLAIYRQWVADGKVVPVGELCDTAAALICHGAQGKATGKTHSATKASS